MRGDEDVADGSGGACGAAPVVRVWALVFGLLLGGPGFGAPVRAAGDGSVPALVRALAHEDFAAARTLAVRSGDRLLVDHVLRREALARPEAPALAELRDLLERRSDWPGMGAIRRIVERRLDELDEATRRALLARWPPRTATGRLFLAELLDRAGERERAREIVRRWWPFADPPLAVEARWRQRFAMVIDPELEAARADRLLWQGRLREVRRLWPRLAPDWRRLVEARLRLRRGAPGVDRAIRAVPRRLRDHPGLVFERVRWRLARDRPSAARDLLEAAPADPAHASAWWRLRRRLVWTFLERGRFRDAWRLLRRYEAPTLVARAEAGWRAGWLALRFLDRPGEAYERFRRLYAAVRSPVSRARMAYWAGRAALRLGNRQVARDWFRRAAAHPTTFYGQRALEELGEAPVATLEAAFATDLGARIVPAAAMDDARLELARRLTLAGGGREALPYLRTVAAAVETPAQASALLAMVAGWGDPSVYVQLAKWLARRGLVPRLRAYPAIAEPAVVRAATRAGIDPALLLALARQESHFAVRARSPAGARGLTQLMPATARALARRHGLPFGPLRLTADPAYQLELAARYLRELLDAFDGDPLAALAAYNAGPARVRRWIARLGPPPRHDRHARLDWIERIPYAETRNYVQRVLEGREVYAALRAAGEPVVRFTLAGMRVVHTPPRPKPGEVGS